MSGRDFDYTPDEIDVAAAPFEGQHPIGVCRCEYGLVRYIVLCTNRIIFYMVYKTREVEKMKSFNEKEFDKRRLNLKTVTFGEGASQVVVRIHICQ